MSHLEDEMTGVVAPPPPRGKRLSQGLSSVPLSTEPELQNRG